MLKNRKSPFFQMLTRLLLVTLLTVFTASLAENVATTTTTTSPTTSSGIRTFTLPTSVINSSLPTTQAIIVENGASDPHQALGDDHEIDLTKQIDDEIADTLEKEAKIETNEVVGAAPAMILNSVGEDGSVDSEEVDDENQMPVLAEVVPFPVEENDEAPENVTGDSSNATNTSEPTTTTTTTTTTTSSGVTSEAHLPQDGVVLPTDNYEVTNKTLTENKKNPTYVPMTFWEQCSLSLSRFADENPKAGMIILSVIFSILLLLIYLVIRECCEKRRRRYKRSYRAPLITDDLYNTSSWSHRYSKIVIPDQKEVTMQLCSTDNSSSIV